MKVREYLVNYSKHTDITFIKARARKDANTPFYHAEYQTTPIYTINELMRSNASILDYYILNDKQPPIDWLSGSPWGTQFKMNTLLSMLVISEEDLSHLYSEEQSKSIIKYIDDNINNNM